MTSRRAARRAERTAHILETAMELLVDEGLDALTVHRLARELEVTAGALYRYFESKDALLAELQVRVIGEFHGQFERVWAAADAHVGSAAPQVVALSRLLISARAFVVLHATRPRRFRLLGQILAEPDPIVADGQTFDTIMAPALALLGAVADRVEHAVEVGAIDGGPPALRRTAMLWGCLQGTVQMHKLARTGTDAFDRDHLARELIDTVLLGWGAERTALDAARTTLDDLDITALLSEETPS